MKPLIHTHNSVRKFGGIVEDYIEIHNFFDSTKEHIPDMRHRAILHNAWGIFLAEKIFGVYIVNSQQKEVSVRDIGEQHVLEDLGTIPTLNDCMKDLPFKRWYGGKATKRMKAKGQFDEDILKGPPPLDGCILIDERTTEPIDFSGIKIIENPLLPPNTAVFQGEVGKEIFLDLNTNEFRKEIQKHFEEIEDNCELEGLDAD